MAEYMTELKEAEERPQDEEGHPDSDMDPKDFRIGELGMELSVMKEQMAQMITYTQAMEQRNQSLAECKH